MDLEQIRTDFPILNRKINGKKLVYLDNAATSQKPRQVINSISEYYETYNANVHRGIHTLSEEASIKYEEAHQKTAKIINAQGIQEIVFTKNTTESLNLLAYSLGLNKLESGDEIVISRMEHHSNLVPWQQVCKKNGAKLRFIELDEQGRLDLGSAEQIIGENTKIVSLVHASNSLGTINPVKEIGKLVHQNGAIFIVDGAQSAPHMPVDVKGINCDFYAFSAHKMAGPTGIGVLYGKKERLEELEPFLFGGDMINKVGYEQSEWNELPWKFEAGTPNIADGIAFGVAIDYLNLIGIDKIRKHETGLTKYAIEHLSEIDGLKILGPEKIGERGGVVSFTIDNIHPHDLAGLLNDDAIAVRAGHHCTMPLMNHLGIDATTRASFYLYNITEEIDKLIESIKKAKEVFT